MSKYEIPDEIPAFGHYLKKINNQDCNFEYCEVMHAPFPIKILRWNMTDFGHVNWVHRRCYHHCKVLVRTGRVTLLEYESIPFLVEILTCPSRPHWPTFVVDRRYSWLSAIFGDVCSL